jgi:hypothetical protein
MSQNKEMTVFWVFAPCSLAVHRAISKPRAIKLLLARGLLIALMMEAASISETLVNFYQTTRRNNSEDSHLNKCVMGRVEESAWQRRKILFHITRDNGFKHNFTISSSV